MIGDVHMLAYIYTINNKQHNNQFIIGDYDIKAFMRAARDRKRREAAAS